MQAEHAPGRTTDDRFFRWACFALTWLALVASGPAGQLYDAAVYTNAPLVLLDGGPVPPGYGIRGALMWLVYLPAALGTKLGLTLEAGVLAQNAVVLAALGAFMLPALLARAGMATRSRVVASCVLVVVVLGRFAPVGFMDLWAAAAVLGAVTLLARPTVVRVLVAGALVGGAVNLRPAYLLSALMLWAAWAIWVRRRWIWLAVGSSMVVLPQGVMALLRPGSWGEWWDGAAAINRLQLGYSAWVVRYDTVPQSLSPQQFFCDPDMAAVQQAPIDSPSELLGHLVTFVPQSIDLVAQKLTAWLMWTWSTPYYDTFEPEISQLSVLVAVLVVLSAVGWVQAARRGDLPLPAVVAGAAVALGVLVGAVAATPETRFALPLVVLGIAGTLMARLERLDARQVAALAGVVVVVVLLGRHALSHPAPPGTVIPETCASASAP